MGDALLDADLIDEIQVLVHPIVLGKGVRLFVDGGRRFPMKLTDTQILTNGVVFLSYQIECPESLHGTWNGRWVWATLGLARLHRGFNIQAFLLDFISAGEAFAQHCDASQKSIVIFNSQVPVGEAQAVYMSAKAEELTGSDLECGLVIYNGRFSDPARHGVQDTRLEEVSPPGLYRLYRAVAFQHWVLDPYASPDRGPR